MKIADKIKSTIITRRAYKGSLMVDEVGLPIDASLDKKLRADLMEMTKQDRVIIYEIKSSLADYRADKKWKGYLDHCELLYFVAPKDVARIIQDEVPSNIGIYEIWDCGYMHCKRVARKTGYQPDTKMIREKLNIQLGYRYAKIHLDRLKVKSIKQD